MTDTLIRWLEGSFLAPLGELLAMGGPVMLVLALLAFAALSAGLYGLFISLLHSPRYTRQLDQSLADWQQGRCPQAALAKSRNPLAGLLAFTLEQGHAAHDPQSLREEVARRAQRLFTPFEPPLKMLEVVAALAPLLGLLGTVMGMMAAFSAMADASGGADPGQLSGGIYEALTTTAAGLIIAIPAAAMAAWLDYRIRRQQQQVNDLLTQALAISVVVPVENPADSPVDSSAETPGAGNAEPAGPADPLEQADARRSAAVAGRTRALMPGTSHATG